MKDEHLEKNVEALRQGNTRAFDLIYERTNRAAYFTILYLVHDKMHAEDILQETYLRAMRSLSQYRAGTNFTAWLCTIARSLALNHLKKAKREVSTDFEADAYKYGTREAEIPYYKRREVSTMLGIPIGTVTWRNNEALRKLKTHLEEDNA